MIKTKNTIGIIGGMGPFASARVLELSLVMARDQFGATNDDDFPEIVFTSIPVKNFFKDKQNTTSALREIKRKIRLLENNDVETFGIACNTAHIFSEDIKRSTNMEFVSIIDETVKIIVSQKFKSVGILGSPVTLNTGLIQKSLEEREIGVVSPNQNQVELLGEIITDLVSKRNTIKNGNLLKRMTELLLAKGAQVVVLGCTELPLAFPENTGMPIIDTTVVLANSLVKRCYISSS